jgi:hypothetical protein
MTSLERSFAPSNNSALYQASACLEDTLTRPVTSEVEAQYWSIFVDPSARFNGAWLHRPRFVRTQSVGMSPSTYAEDSDGNQLSWRTTPIRNVTSASVDVSTGELLCPRCSFGVAGLLGRGAARHSYALFCELCSESAVGNSSIFLT